MHTFLLLPGKWTLKGSLIQGSAPVTSFQGRMVVGWSQDMYWFTMISKMQFSDGRADEVASAKGRMDNNERRFTYVLEHSELGKVEGEGLISPGAIAMSYFVRDDAKSRTGFQTYYRQDDNHYAMTSGIMLRQGFESMMETAMVRHLE